MTDLTIAEQTVIAYTDNKFNLRTITESLRPKYVKSENKIVDPTPGELYTTPQWFTNTLSIYLCLADGVVVCAKIYETGQILLTGGKGMHHQIETVCRLMKRLPINDIIVTLEIISTSAVIESPYKISKEVLPKIIDGTFYMDNYDHSLILGYDLSCPIEPQTCRQIIIHDGHTTITDVEIQPTQKKRVRRVATAQIESAKRITVSAKNPKELREVYEAVSQFLEEHRNELDANAGWWSGWLPYLFSGYGRSTTN